MKASELIVALQAAIEQHGDRDVHVYDDGAWTEPVLKVLSAEDAKAPREWSSVPPGDFSL